MRETKDAQWLAFEVLAKKHPNDHGVRITAHLAKWLMEECRQRRLPIPPIIRKVVGAS